MTDPRIIKMAKVIVEYSLALREKELFRIEGTYLATPLIQEVYRAALAVGAHPYTKVAIPELTEIFYRYASDEQILFLSDIEKREAELLQARLFIYSDSNIKSLANIDSKKIARWREGQRPILSLLLTRKAQGELKSCLTLFPTQSFAQEAEMSLSEYEEFVFSACFLNSPDPIAEWQKLSAEQARLVSFLNKIHQIKVIGPSTDLTFSVAGRQWINSDGRANFPSGEIFTCPVEDSVFGLIHFSYPAIYLGREVRGITLQFQDGKVIRATAEKGQDLLDALLNLDAGARTLGEFAFGNNKNIQRFTKMILFDEKIGGTIHCALGAAYPETGGKNQSSFHWDMICDMHQGQVYADGKLIYENGKFLI